MNLVAAGVFEKSSQEARERSRKENNLMQRYITEIATEYCSIFFTYRWRTEALTHQLSSPFFEGFLWEMLLLYPFALWFCTGQVGYYIFRENTKAEKEVNTQSAPEAKTANWIQPHRDCTTAASGIRGGPRGYEQETKSLQYSPPLALFKSGFCIMPTMILFKRGDALLNFLV